MTPEQAAVKSAEFLQQIEKHLKGGSSAVSGALAAKGLKALRADADHLGKQLRGTTDACKTLKNELHRAAAALHKLTLGLGGAGKEEIKKKIAAERVTRKLADSQRRAALATAGANRKMSGLAATAAAVDRKLEHLEAGSRQSADGMIDLGTRVGLAWAAFDGLVDLISGPLKRVLTDYMMLTERGIGGSIGQLYYSAARAGMSLQEYVAVLEENRAALARAGSLEDFNRRLESTSRRLGDLGIFGADARRLAAAMQNSAVTLGIPQARLAASTEAQVKVFEDLRKSTMLTSEGFKQLISDFSSNQSVQEALLGTAKAEREARRGQLFEIFQLGHALGLTEEAAGRLAQALIDQRRATLKERFEAAGRARQLGALTGMSATETEELARLLQKKNLQADEAGRLTQLAGQAKARLETLKNTGNLAAEFAAEQLEALLPPQQRQLMEAAGAAALQVEAGAVINKNLGEATGRFARAVGEFATAVTGFTKSPAYDVVKVLAEALGPLAAVLGGGFFLKKILGRDRVTGERPARAAPVSPGMRGALSSFSLSDVIKGQLQRADLKGIFPSIFKAGGIFSALFAGIEEALTGEMTAALGLGDGLFGKITGIIVAGLNGVVTGVTRLLDGALSSVFGLLGMELQVNITKFADYATSAMTDFVKTIAAGFLKALATGIEKVMGIFGLEAPFAKSLRATAQEISASIAESTRNREEMMRTNSTLREIGARNLRAQEENAKKSDRLSAKINSNIAYGIDDLISQAAATSRHLQAETAAGRTIAAPQVVQAEVPAASPRKIQAAPVAEARSSVTVPEVNRDTRQAGEVDRPAETRVTGGQEGAEEMVVISKQQLQVLRQIYEVVVAQNEALSGAADSLLAGLSKNPGRPYEVPHMISRIIAA